MKKTDNKKEARSLPKAPFREAV